MYILKNMGNTLNRRKIIITKPVENDYLDEILDPDEEEYAEPLEENPVYSEEQTQQGFRYSAYAAACAIALIIPGFSLPAIFLGTFFIRRARKNGNPAIVGSIIRVLNIVESIILAIILIIAIIGGILWYQDLENQQRQQIPYSTSSTQPTQQQYQTHIPTK